MQKVVGLVEDAFFIALLLAVCVGEPLAETFYNVRMAVCDAWRRVFTS